MNDDNTSEAICPAIGSVPAHSLRPDRCLTLPESTSALHIMGKAADASETRGMCERALRLLAQQMLCPSVFSRS